MAVVACEQQVAQRQVDVIHRAVDSAKSGERGEVSLKEVESIMGQPAESHREKRPRQVTVHEEVVRNIYRVDGKKMTATFVDGRLTGPLQAVDVAASAAEAGATEPKK
jgi:hypothetical protein